MGKKTNSGEETIWNKDFICVAVCNFMLCLSHSSVNPLVASYTKLLGTSAQITGLLTGMFFAVALAMRPIAGPVTTKLDKRKLLIFTFVLGSLVNLGYALFHSIPAFIVFRFLNGVQYSLMGSLIMTLASDHLPESKLAHGLGLYGALGAIANAIGPSVGITLLNYGTARRDEHFGFTLVFLFAMVTLLPTLIPSVLISPDKKTKAEVSETGAWYKNIFAKQAAPIACVLFLVMIPYSLLNTYMVEFGKEQGIPGVNLFYLVLALALAVSRPLSGYLADRFGLKRTIFPAMALFGLSMLLVGFSRSLLPALAGAALAAIGFGATQPSLQAMCIQMEPPNRHGVATNTIYMGLDLGLFLGPMLGGLVYGVSDYSVMFKAGAVPLALAIVGFAIVLPSYRRRLEELERKV